MWKENSRNVAIEERVAPDRDFTAGRINTRNDVRGTSGRSTDGGHNTVFLFLFIYFFFRDFIFIFFSSFILSLSLSVAILKDQDAIPR